MKIPIYFAALSLLVSSCVESSEDYIEKNRRQLLRLKTDVKSLPADGKSFFTITAFMPADADLRTLQFKSSHGTFRYSDSSTISIEASPYLDSLRGQVFLTTEIETQAFVSITVSAQKLDSTVFVSFTPALADSIANESTVASIPSGFGSEVPVTTILFRKHGKPSISQLATFKAFRSNKSPIGEFRDISLNGSNETGIINSKFVLKDTVYTGPVKIVSLYKGARLYTDTLTIHVTKK